MTHLLTNEGPLDCLSRSSSCDASSSSESALIAHQETKTFRAHSRSTPTPSSNISRASTAEAALAGSPVAFLPYEATRQGGDSGKEANSAKETISPESHPLPTDTLPPLGDVDGHMSSSSVISSHDSSFCNSLIVSQKERGVPAGLSGRDALHSSPAQRSRDRIAEPPALQIPQSYHPNSHDDGESDEDGANGAARARATPSASRLRATPLPAAAAAYAHDSPCHSQAASTTENNTRGTKQQRPHSRSGEASLTAHSSSSTSTESRRCRGATSPGSEVRTLRELMVWRSHLSESQRSHDPNNSHSDAVTQHSSEAVSPLMCKSAAAPPLTDRAAAVGRYPASTPVTPGLWTPSGLKEAESEMKIAAATTSAVSSPTPEMASPLVVSTTGDLDGRHAVRADGVSDCVGRLCRSPSPSGASNSPPLLASHRTSPSQLVGSFASLATSHLASPAQAAAVAAAAASPRETVTSTPNSSHSPADLLITRNGTHDDTSLSASAASSPALCTPRTERHTRPAATGAAVQDTRHATHLHATTAATAKHDDDYFSSEQQASKPGRPASLASPAESEWSAWAGVDDHAPSHLARTPVAAALPHLSPTRDHLITRPLSEPPAALSSPSSSSASTQRISQPLLGSRATSQEVFHGSPASHGLPLQQKQQKTCGSSRSAGERPLQLATVTHLHRANSSNLTLSSDSRSGLTPRPHNSNPLGVTRKKSRHSSPTLRRQMDVLEEYPAFATPVDEDTNKAVIAFVTGLLLLVCLAFIYAM